MAKRKSISTKFSEVIGEALGFEHETEETQLDVEQEIEKIEEEKTIEDDQMMNHPKFDKFK